jgi:beta-galactosidase
VSSYTQGPLAGVPAITRHGYGTGTAWYVATLPDPATLAALLDRVREETGVRPVLDGGVPTGVEAVRRRGDDADYLFLIDHAGTGAKVSVAGETLELLAGNPVSDGSVTLPPGGVAVIREPRGA